MFLMKLTAISLMKTKMTIARLVVTKVLIGKCHIKVHYNSNGSDYNQNQNRTDLVIHY